MNNILYRIEEAANCKKNASEFTHSLYRYPASMSPILAREIILSFTIKKDFILDPFCGGGTSAIESMINGRKIICSDISPLASFITRAKSTPLKKDIINYTSNWYHHTLERLNAYKKAEMPDNYKLKDNLHSKKTIWILNKLKEDINEIQNEQVKDIANLILLCVGKYCYDCQDKRLNPFRLVKSFEKASQMTLKSISDFSDECFRNSIRLNLNNDLQIYCKNALELPKLIDKKIAKKIKLVLTSPPYPGVHILYHRWQVKGRRQTSLPFDLLNISDGYPTQHYTLGAVTQKGYDFYFNNIYKIFSGLNEIISEYTTVAQVVSFKEPEWQLQKYLQAMKNAGFKEVLLKNRKREIITREIPNRKWYTNLNDKKATEYVLFHRKK